ncbi:MAG: hypothetical protein ACI4PY_06445 [Akkermansia muciniphila]
MKRRYIPLLMVTGVVLGSCVGVQRVNLPDMPYRKPIQRTTLPPNTAPVTPPVLPTAPTGAGSGAAIPAPKVTPPPAPKPATPTTTAPKPATPAQPKLPKPEQPKLPTPTVPPTPAVTPPAPSTPSITHPTVTPPAPTVSPNPPATPAPTPAPVKKITNEGGKIPVAVQVEGDPTRVYNPLDPSRKLRIIDKNGNRVSSGKKMKVPGTDFIFIVP